MVHLKFGDWKKKKKSFEEIVFWTLSPGSVWNIKMKIWILKEVFFLWYIIILKNIKFDIF